MAAADDPPGRNDDALAETVPPAAAASTEPPPTRAPAPASGRGGDTLPVSGDETLPAGGGLLGAGSATPATPVVVRGGGDAAPLELGVLDRGRYTIEKPLAAGGMGRILVARDRRLGRRVAIKELLASTPGLRARFEREARLTAQLTHPSIISVHEAGRWPDGEPTYVMELVAGRPFDEVIAGSGGLPGRLALLPHLIAVADAMAYAHGQRVIHRDLKPRNVLVGDFGETVVIDWGLARRLDEAFARAPDAGPYRAAPADGPADATAAGEVLGTPSYMPPEQARGEAVDERADVYALGAMLDHLLSGKPPYLGPTAQSVLAQVIDGPPEPLAERARGAPPDLVALAARAMARDPAARYAGAAEVAAELRRFQTGQLVGAYRYTLGELLRRWARRHRVALTVAAAALLVLAVGSVVAMNRVMTARDRAERGERGALAATARAEQERAVAIAAANQAVLAQARAAIERDPAEALAWLAQLDPAGPGWADARTLATSARHLHPAERIWMPLADAPRALHLHPDGRRVIVEGTDDRAIVDLVAGTVGRRMPTDGNMRLCPDGTRMVDGARVWDLARGEIVARSVDEPGCMAPSAPFVVDDEEGEVLAQAPDGTRRRLGRTAADALWVTSDGKHAITWDERGGVARWDADGARGAARAVGTRPFIDTPLMSADGRFVAALEPTLTFVDLEAGTRVVTGLTGASTAAMDPEGRWFAAVIDGRFQAWNERGEPIGYGERPTGVIGLAPRADGDRLAVWGDGLVVLETRSFSGRALRGHRGPLTGVLWAGEDRLVSAGLDATLRVWAR